MFFFPAYPTDLYAGLSLIVPLFLAPHLFSSSELLDTQNLYLSEADKDELTPRYSQREAGLWDFSYSRSGDMISWSSLKHFSEGPYPKRGIRVNRRETDKFVYGHTLIYRFSNILAPGSLFIPSQV